MQVIAVANRKGGVGKSTVSANLAAALAQKGQRILVIDMDSQGSATGTLLETVPENASMGHVMIGQATLVDIIVPSTVKNVWVAPATEQLTHAQLAIVNKPGRETILRRALRTIPADQFDLIVIDTAPERQLNTVNALVAATHVLMPFTGDAKALEGLNTTAQAIADITEAELAAPQILGCIQVAHDTRLAISRDAREIVAENWGDLMLKTALRVNSSFVLCPAVHRSIFEIEQSARTPRRGTEDVLAMAEEVQRRLRQTQAAA